ncbi:glycosyltransferase family 2 protein [Microvirga zambiensis]|uniref:glycosyltransferase family 2 protein n=1 Tax=Microvirga zambiensis TaxID=1402137 RepID=UPI00191E1B76|nr:glycosyltransferase [Microvirga zambiensis]
MRALLKAALSGIPWPVRRMMKAVVPGGFVQATAKLVAPPIQAPPPAPVPKEPPRKDIARLLFDPRWYVSRHPEVPADHDEAYKHYQTNGRLAGHSPTPLFADVPLPVRTTLPQEHLFRATASPILSRMPPTQYLELYRFREKRTVYRPSTTLAEYLRRAMIKPDLIGPDLTEYDLRIVAYMDGEKKRFSADNIEASQADLVSIVLVAADDVGVLEDTIVSVLIQSHENWELIVANIGDRAEADAVVCQFDDARIKRLPLDGYITAGQARNACVAASSGNLIAYLAPTTLWDPDCLLVLRNRMRATGARASYGAQVVWNGFDADSRLGWSFKSIRFSPFNRSLIENLDTLSTTVLIHDRSLFDEVGPFDDSLSGHVDWDWITRMTEATRPEAAPCLLGHHFLPQRNESITSETSVESVARERDGEVAALREARAKLAARADWSQPFMTTDGREHLAFSISRTVRAARRGKLAGLPAERVQILIPNYESLDELAMCLASIAEHTPSPYNVLVVDNGSSDETYARLESMIASLDHASLLRETSASGFSIAVNRGLAELADRNDKILILNNDTLVTPDWLDELRYVLFKHEGAGMAVPRQVIPAGTKALKLHMPAADTRFECDINLSSQHDNILDPDFDPDDNLVELGFAPLFCGLIRPETIKALGGLDERNGPHYRSDWIFCEALRRILNQRILYTPHSKIYHLQGVATRVRDTSTQLRLDQSSVAQPAPDARAKPDHQSERP